MVLIMINDKELKCCLFCGRDTTNLCQICLYCLGERDLPKEWGRKLVEAGAWQDEFINRGCELEDRYDEESGPDDVWPDWEFFE